MSIEEIAQTVPTIHPPLFRNRRYLFLVGAGAVSNVGDWLYIMALFVLVGFHWHSSPLVISLMMLCLAGPMALLGPFTGILADRYNRTSLMALSNLVMAGLVAVIPVLPARWMVFAMLVLVGAFESLFNPAASGKLKELVPDEQMQQAASINSSIVQLTKVIGPGLSGFLVAAFGSMSAFWLDSVSFVLSTFLLLFTGFRTLSQTNPSAAPPVETQTPAKVPAKQRFLEGLNHIRSVRILLAGTVILTVAILLIQLTDAQIVTLIRVIPGGTSSLIGLIMGFSGAGGLLAALFVGVVKWKSSSRIMAIGALLIGGGLGAAALIAQYITVHSHVTPLWMTVFSVVAILVGIGAGLILIPFQATAQRLTPGHLTGRVFGTIGSLTTSAALLGPAAGGLLVTGIGIVAAYLVTAILLFVMGVTVLTLHRWLEPASDAAPDGEPVAL